MFPNEKEEEKEKNLWQIRLRASFYVALNLIGFFALPTAGFTVALINRDVSNTAFLWNIAFFCNSIYLLSFLLNALVIPALMLAIHPRYRPTKDDKVFSIAIKNSR